MDPLLEFALCVKGLTRDLEHITHDAVRHLGITGAQADALVVIGQAPGISLRELGDLLIAESGHPSRMVDRLVDAGLVKRTADRDDRRRVELSLTARGRRLAERVEQLRHELYDAGRQVLDMEALAHVTGVLRELLRESPHGGLIERRKALYRSSAGPSSAATRPTRSPP